MRWSIFALALSLLTLAGPSFVSASTQCTGTLPIVLPCYPSNWGFMGYVEYDSALSGINYVTGSTTDILYFLSTETESFTTEAPTPKVVNVDPVINQRVSSRYENGVLTNQTPTNNLYIRSQAETWGVSANGGFGLEFYLSIIDRSYAIEDVGCVSEDYVTSCAIATSTYAIAIQATTSSSLIFPWKYEYLLTYLDRQPIEPQTAYSKSTLYNSLGSDRRTDALIFPNQDKAVYRLLVCDADTAVFPLAFGNVAGSYCKNMFIGNGYTSSELSTMLSSMGVLTVMPVQGRIDIATVWEENGCSELGLTDVFPAIKCAFIWAFEPSQVATQSFYAVSDRLLTVFPIGYATLIYEELASSTTSTSTAIFDRGINFGKWFGVEGTATTTFSSTALLSEMSMVDKIVDFLSLLMWGGFVILLLIFGFTRTL